MFKLPRYLFCACVLGWQINAFADEVEVLANVAETYAAVQQFCGDISDRISKVSGVAKANTAVTAVGTAASGGALAVGIAKTSVDKKIEDLQKRICERGGCDPDKVSAMSDDDFLDIVLVDFAEILTLQNDLKEEMAKSKRLGNWRTGLMIGGMGTNVASAIIAGLNKNQSDLIQQITACNTAVEKLRIARSEAIRDGVDPLKTSGFSKYTHAVQECGTLNTDDVDKIERRMSVVMGTSIGGAVAGAIGTGTSIAANKDSVRNDNTDAGKQKERALNTTANVSAGVATATGAVGTGFNISLITLTKKLIKAAEQCEEIL